MAREPGCTLPLIEVCETHFVALAIVFPMRSVPETCTYEGDHTVMNGVPTTASLPALIEDKFGRS